VKLSGFIKKPDDYPKSSPQTDKQNREKKKRKPRVF